MAWFHRSKAATPEPQQPLPQAAAPPPEPPASWAPPGFRLTAEDVFSISDRGTVVTGRVEAGTLTKGNTVHLTRLDGTIRDVEVTGIEMFRKIAHTTTAGDNVGLVLRGLAREDVGPGDVLST